MVPTLSELQRIPTSGARAVESFRVGDRDLLAIPQLALDVPGTPAGMNVGDSNTEMLILERRDGDYTPCATVPAPGGEDAEFFAIGGRRFLAAACIRTGSGPYDYDTESFVYEWTGERFELFWSVSTFAAKQWKHWTIGDRHFLGLAQGLALPQFEGHNRSSVIFEWDGEQFVEFQIIPSQWAYNWHPFEIDGQLLRRPRRPRHRQRPVRLGRRSLRRPPEPPAQLRPGLRPLHRRSTTTWWWPDSPSHRPCCAGTASAS